MGYQTITLEPRFDGRVSRIVLGPPPANIVTATMIEELTDALEKHGGSEYRDTCLVEITGGGKHFSFGASVEEHRPESIADMLPRLHEFIGRLIEFEIPTIASIRGLCLGGGFEVAMACSMIFADPGAKFAVPEIQLAVFPPVASVLLPVLAPQAQATRIILTGDQFSADDMHRFGLVSVVSPEGSLAATIDAFIETHMLPKSASSLRFACRAARSALAKHYKSHIDRVEQLYLDELMKTADAVEGIEAFVDKRKPAWKNA